MKIAFQHFDEIRGGSGHIRPPIEGAIESDTNRGQSGLHSRVIDTHCEERTDVGVIEKNFRSQVCRIIPEDGIAYINVKISKTIKTSAFARPRVISVNRIIGNYWRGIEAENTTAIGEHSFRYVGVDNVVMDDGG